MLLNSTQCHKNVNEQCLHFNICQLSLLTFKMVKVVPVVPIDFDVGVNESILFSFVCPMTHMNAQKCC